MDYLSSLFTHSVVSDSLRPHGLQHARLPVLYHLPELAPAETNAFTRVLVRGRQKVHKERVCDNGSRGTSRERK